MQLACKPGSVGILSSTREPGIPFHHLSGPVIAGGIIRPTPRHRTSSPQAPVYMVFQPIRCTASCVTTGTGELLPHLFTLIPTGSGRLFSVALLYPHGYLPVRKYGALCCPDFPFRLSAERWNGLLQLQN